MTDADSAAKAIADRLAAQGYGTLAGQSGWGIFIGGEPSKPDTCITLYDTGGTSPNQEAELYDPLLQIRVRAHDYGDGYNKAASIRDYLFQLTGATIGNWYYTGFWLVNDIQPIKKDENNRWVFTVNFRLMKQPVNSA